MNIKTMDGLIGAGVNMNLMDVPIRVYKEARRKGDMATMERAMGYAGDFAKKAWEYEAKADEGMKEEAREEKEKEKEALAETIEKRREERRAEQEALEEKDEAQRSEDTADKKDEGIEDGGTDGTEVPQAKTGTVPKETGKKDRPALYTSTGSVRKPVEQGVGTSVSVRA